MLRQTKTLDPYRFPTKFSKKTSLKRTLKSRHLVKMDKFFIPRAITSIKTFPFFFCFYCFEYIKRQVKTSKSEWMLNNIRIEKIISPPIRATNFFFFFFFFFEVSALLNARHCPKLQSSTISRKTNDGTLRKWENP